MIKLGLEVVVGNNDCVWVGVIVIDGEGDGDGDVVRVTVCVGILSNANTEIFFVSVEFWIRRTGMRTVVAEQFDTAHVLEVGGLNAHSFHLLRSHGMPRRCERQFVMQGRSSGDR